MEDATLSAATLSDADITCPLCGARFTRVEHRNRHVLSHNDSKAHACANCKKKFTRRDTLIRHLTIHGSKSCVSKAGIAARVNRACTSCARLRVKCDGNFPCSRCATRSLSCEYASRSSQRIATISELKGLPLPVRTDSDGELAPDPTQNGAADRLPRRITSGPAMSSPERAVLDALYSLSNGAPPMGGSAGELDPTMPLLAEACEPPPPPFTPGFSSAETLWDAEPSSAMALDFVASWDQDFSVLDWMTLDFGLGGMAVSSDDYLPMSEPGLYSENDVATQAYQAEILAIQQMTRYPSHMPSRGAITLPLPPPPATLTRSFQRRRSRTSTRQPTPESITFDPSPSTPGLKKPHEWPNDWTPKKTDNIITFPDLTSVSTDQLDIENFGHVAALDRKTYAEIQGLLRRTSGGQIPGHSFPPFRTPHLPSQEAFDCCIQLYFEYFHPIFPMLHKATFRPATAPWRLVLATAAIGCRYSRVARLAQCANALQELLRRAVFDAVEQDNSNARELWYTQIVVLNHVGMTYSGNKRLLEIAEGYRNLSATLCRRKWKEMKGNSGKGAGLRMSSGKGGAGEDAEERWRRWVEEEAHTRVYHSVFVTDAQYALFFDGVPCLPVEELLHQQLPCTESLWDAQNAAAWDGLLRQQEASPALGAVLTSLCSPKASSTLPSTGHFAQLILVLAIHQAATSTKRLSHHLTLFDPTHDPSSLHAGAVARARLGLEALGSAVSTSRDHPLGRSVECHILFVLVVLLSARDHLLNHAHCFATNEETPAARQHVMRWLELEGGEPARRAVLYAGRLMGSLRSWSSHGPHEPVMTLLCTVVLWTYGRIGGVGNMKADETSGGGMGGRGNNSGIDPSTMIGCAATQIIRIDAYGSANLAGAADWIAGREGARVHLRDVGCLSRPGAASVVLELGIAALRGPKTWAPGHGFAVWLSELKGRCEASDTER